MSSWKEVTLDEIAEIAMGSSPDSSYVNEDFVGFPFLQGCAEFGNIKPKAIYFTPKPSKISKKGAILMSVRAPVGDINLGDKEYCIGRGLASIKPNIEIEFGYLYNWILLNREFLYRRSQGSTFDAINSKDLKDYPVFLPPLPQQKKIASILGTVDAQIEATEKLITKYEMLKDGLFKKFLFEFDSTQKPLNSLGNLYSGKDYKVNPPIKSKQYPIYGTGGIMGYTSKYLIDGNTLLLGRKGSIQTVRIVTGKIWNVDTAFAYQTNDENILYWIFFVLSYTDLSILNEATGVPSVSSTAWLKFKVPIPNDASDIEFGVNKIKLQEKLIRKEQQMLQKLLTLKKGLMQDLLGGKREV